MCATTMVRVGFQHKPERSCVLFDGSEYRAVLVCWCRRYRRSQAQRGRITLSTQADRNGDVITSLAMAFLDANDPGYCIESVNIESASSKWRQWG